MGKKNKGGAVAALEALESACDAGMPAKTIKIAIAAHEIFNRYTKKSTGFFGWLCFIIKKIFGAHKGVEAQNKKVNEIYQRIIAKAQGCYQAHSSSSNVINSLPQPVQSPRPVFLLHPEKAEEIIPLPEPQISSSSSSSSNSSSSTLPPVTVAPPSSLTSDIEVLAPETEPRPSPEQVAAIVNRLTTEINTEPMKARIEEKKREFNEKAFEQLLIELRKNAAIPEEFVNELKADWENPLKENGLIPPDIKKHEKLFNRGLRITILQAAEKAIEKAAAESDKNTIAEGLENLRRNIDEELARGKIIPAEKVIQERYKELFAALKKAQEGEILSATELETWKNQYNDIVNQAYLKFKVNSSNELSLKRITGNIIENKLLELLGSGNANDPVEREKRNLANLSVMKTMLSVMKTMLRGQGLDKISIDELKLEVAKEQRLARIKSSLRVKHPERVAEVIDMVEEKHRDFLIEAQPHMDKVDSLSKECPAKAKDFILKYKKHGVESFINRGINHLIEKRKIEIKDYVSGNADKFNFDTQLPVEHISKLEKALADINFYNRWGACFTTVLRQGDEDYNEDLGNGVCLGVTLRLIKEELENKEPQMVILPEDRVSQVIYEGAAIIKPSAGEVANKSLLELKNEFCYSEVLRNRFNFAPLAADSTICDKSKGWKEGLSAYLKPILQDNCELYKTIIDMSIKLPGEEGHALYLRCDWKNNIFRIGDCNHGLIEFKKGRTKAENKDALLDCFADLMEKYKTVECEFNNWQLKPVGQPINSP